MSRSLFWVALVVCVAGAHRNARAQQTFVGPTIGVFRYHG